MMVIRKISGAVQQLIHATSTYLHPVLPAQWEPVHLLHSIQPVVVSVVEFLTRGVVMVSAEATHLLHSMHQVQREITLTLLLPVKMDAAIKPQQFRLPWLQDATSPYLHLHHHRALLPVAASRSAIYARAPTAAVFLMPGVATGLTATVHRLTSPHRVQQVIIPIQLQPARVVVQIKQLMFQ